MESLRPGRDEAPLNIRLSRLESYRPYFQYSIEKIQRQDMVSETRFEGRARSRRVQERNGKGPETKRKDTYRTGIRPLGSKAGEVQKRGGRDPEAKRADEGSGADEI